MTDIAIIGAGPAGMAAAVLAAEYGADTLVLDEGSGPGGQIYRGIEKPGNPARPELGKSYAAGAGLARAFRASRARHVAGASVWHVGSDLELAYSDASGARTLHAGQIILAGGAQERPMPVQGWTLPGVMGAGAAQTILKDSGLTIRDAVFIGTGPLLYLIVHQYLIAGIAVKAVIDVAPKGNRLQALRHLPGAILAAPRLFEGWQWQRRIARSGTEFIRGAEDIRITGTRNADGVDYLKGGRWHRLECRHVLLHQGVVPNINMPMAVGCDTFWNPRQLCWNVTTDAWQASSVDGIAVAGDSAGIGGAVAARNQGSLAALGALFRLGRIDATTRDRLARPYRRALWRELAARPFLETLFRPPVSTRIPAGDDVIVCRCEELTASDIRRLVAQGHTGPNQIKSQSRCGMGPCQGRFCGLTVCEMLARQNRVPISEVGYFRLRAPLKPLPLDQLAALRPDTGAES